jgi:hypothetical protein
MAGPTGAWVCVRCWYEEGKATGMYKVREPGDACPLCESVTPCEECVANEVKVVATAFDDRLIAVEFLTGSSKGQTTVLRQGVTDDGRVVYSK